MKFLFDFGLSQEDPLTEQFVLDISPSDSILSLASGGEVPLSLLSLNENIRVVAVDISESQIKLCRLKLTAALKLDFPENGQFLGYAQMDAKTRITIYREKIRPFLTPGDLIFWDEHIQYILDGIINAGRFEQYIRKMRFIARIFIGGKNLKKLISCRSLDEQAAVFDQNIATRKSLRLLFKVAFHPAIYKKRGLQEQALIHAGKTTGERFYSRFRDFCTGNPAGENYFLQFFLTGTCQNEASFPHYLQPENKTRLIRNLANLELKTVSFQNALSENPRGHFNKIHLSNLGDWITKEQFAELISLLQNNCLPGTKICYRYLQKNHFRDVVSELFSIDQELSEIAIKKDRFPFYGIVPVIISNQPND
jgi:S-adenosylmethionine:diacylglycerol 3-amino-3-carboxypropyl transferase